MKKYIQQTILLLSLICYSSTAFAQTDTLTERHPEYLPQMAKGTLAPDFTAPDTLGNKISLSNYRGKYVVLDFWATWCGDCRREIPFLHQLYNDTKNATINNTPIQWLSMSFDRKAEQWQSFLRKEQFPWPQISNLKTTREDPTFKAYQLRWIPAFLIIDPQGYVVAKAITAQGLRAEINKLIAPVTEGGKLLRVLTVNCYADSVILRTPCTDYSIKELKSTEFQQLAKNMIATVTHPSQDGVGIAGPQVGVSKRVIAVMRYDKEGHPFEIYPNIRITAFHGEKQAGPEGCLSVPGKRGEVMRYRDIDIEYTSPTTFKTVRENVKGFTAVIFQHETDHLEDVLYTDKLIKN